MRFSDIFRRKPKLAKHPDFSKMEYKFTDSLGRRYYSYVNDYDIPIKRKGMFQVFLIELREGMDRDERDIFVEAMLSELNKSELDRAKMAALCHEMKLRGEFLLIEEIMFKMVAALYIREDQKPQVWDNELEIQKAQFLQKEAQDNLFDFFEKASLGKYIPYLKEFKGTLREFLGSVAKKRRAGLMWIKEVFGLDRKSLKTLENKLTNLWYSQRETQASTGS